MAVKTDSRVDAYIERAAPFARPILVRVRQLVHSACPEAEETLKWSRPAFALDGQLLCLLSAFKAHCGVHFWHPEVSAMISHELAKSDDGTGQFGRLGSLADLPDDETLRRYLVEAARLAATGKPARPKLAAAARQPAAAAPADLAAALAGNTAARAAFEGFPPGQRREYVAWITEAKRAETRAKRLATAIEWLEQGKRRNWKYENCSGLQGRRPARPAKITSRA